MSVINKMLQELDRRQAIPGPTGILPPKHVRPVETERRREWFWRLISILMLAAVGWVGWVAYQLQPRAIATEKAFKAAEEARARSGLVAAKSEVPGPTPAQPSPNPADAVPRPNANGKAARDEEVLPATKPEPIAPAVEPAAVAARADAKTPPPAGDGVATVAGPKAPAGAASAPAAETAPAAAPRPKARKKAPVEQVSRPAPDTLSALGLPPARVLLGTSRVERRDRTSGPRDVAERDFRTGVDMLKQGRAADAEASFGAAIAKDPSHRAARQALVALSLDAGHLETARGLLQDGLALDPAQADFAFILARILVERQDYAGAFKVLEGGAAGATNMADYQALRGAVLQKLNRYEESTLAYRSALQIQSTLPVAWVGLGISLEATERRSEAAEAFRRALRAGPMAEDLRAFAEQRARALQ